IESLGVDFLRAGEEIAPDAGGGGQFGYGAAEGLDRQPAVVAKFLENADRLADLRMAAPWRAAVILRDVDVGEIARSVQCAQRGNRVLFLDMRVEGVVEDADAAHPLGIGDRLLAGVEQIGLEAVQRLQTRRYARLGHQWQD